MHHRVGRDEATPSLRRALPCCLLGAPRIPVCVYKEFRKCARFSSSVRTSSRIHGGTCVVESSHQEGVPTVGPRLRSAQPFQDYATTRCLTIGDRSRSGNEPINHVRTELLATRAEAPHVGCRPSAFRRQGRQCAIRLRAPSTLRKDASNCSLSRNRRLKHSSQIVPPNNDLSQLGEVEVVDERVIDDESARASYALALSAPQHLVATLLVPVSSTRTHPIR